jgi:pimeloyl-ACP methyl ester carboxylesterase
MALTCSPCPDDWYDNTRDILNFLWHYLPENPSAGREWPLHLPILPSSISTLRKKSGFASRTLVSIGHSLGGGTTALAAYNAPQLFSTLILVDPIIESRDEYDRSPLPYGAVKRRSHWPSR